MELCESFCPHETLWPVYLAMPQGTDLTVEHPNTFTPKGGCGHVTDTMMALVSLLNFWASEPISWLANMI